MNKIFVDRKELEIKESGNYILEFGEIDNLEIIISDSLEVNLFCVDVDIIIDRTINYRLLDNSKLSVIKFYNNKKVVENIIIDLDGFNSSINYCFSGIAINYEDYNMVINHNNKKVKSYISNHLIAMDNSKINFNIDSNVDYGNKGCIMDQNTKIINLGENRSKINPNMYIDEYDVEARHGSVIGQFREEDLFYLMSRGISYNDSLKLLVKGFLLSNIFDDEIIVNSVMNTINKYWR